MNQLTTETKSHVIVTFSKSHHFITQKQYDALIAMGVSAQIIVDGNIIKTNNIAEIITIQKYYEAHPEKRSQNYGQPYSDAPAMGYHGIMTMAQRAGKLEHLLKGMKRTAAKGNYLVRKVEQRITALHEGREEGRSNNKIYNPKFVFHPEKETWEQFQERTRQGVVG